MVHERPAYTFATVCIDVLRAEIERLRADVARLTAEVVMWKGAVLLAERNANDARAELAALRARLEKADKLAEQVEFRRFANGLPVEMAVCLAAYRASGVGDRKTSTSGETTVTNSVWEDESAVIEWINDGWRFMVFAQENGKLCWNIVTRNYSDYGDIPVDVFYDFLANYRASGGVVTKDLLPCGHSYDDLVVDFNEPSWYAYCYACKHASGGAGDGVRE
jgi:hypothetical protein